MSALNCNLGQMTSLKEPLASSVQWEDASKSLCEFEASLLFIETSQTDRTAHTLSLKAK